MNILLFQPKKWKQFSFGILGSIYIRECTRVTAVRVYQIWYVKTLTCHLSPLIVFISITAVVENLQIF